MNDLSEDREMVAKRIIPCLDVHAGQVTRGQQFGRAEQQGLKNVGDPVELALRYDQQGADELVFYDITASAEGRTNMIEVIQRAADQCFMPLTVGGGIRAVEDMRQMLKAGADKVSINTSAITNPELITAGSEIFGAQCIVVSIDCKKMAENRWKVFTHGGRKETEWEVLAWAQKAVSLGAGELVLNSIDGDGMKNGYDLALNRSVSTQVPVPVVASGGAGKIEDFAEVLEIGKADAALAAGVFHSGLITVQEVKRHLKSRGIPVRWIEGE